MARCAVCGEGTDMPYVCSRCGQPHCSEHRLPESHDCVGLEEWNDPAGVFREETGGERAVPSPVGSRLGSLRSYVRGNVTFVVLGLMWMTFLAQVAFQIATGIYPPTPATVQANPEAYELYRSIFVISTDNPLYVWTWITSIFAHSTTNFFHVVFNSIVIFFFGRLVEQYLGSRDFALLFVGSGVIAGLSQIGHTLLTAPGASSGALGASGAALAIMGVLTVLNPRLKVYLYFIIPMPIWALTAGIALISLFAIETGVAGGIAHVAHFVGLVIGLVVGYHVRNAVRPPRQIRFGGGGPGPGGPGGRI